MFNRSWRVWNSNSKYHNILRACKKFYWVELDRSCITQSSKYIESFTRRLNAFWSGCSCLFLLRWICEQTSYTRHLSRRTFFKISDILSLTTSFTSIKLDHQNQPNQKFLQASINGRRYYITKLELHCYKIGYLGRSYLEVFIWSFGIFLRKRNLLFVLPNLDFFDRKKRVAKPVIFLLKIRNSNHLYCRFVMIFDIISLKLWLFFSNRALNKIRDYLQKWLFAVTVRDFKC